MDWTSQDDIEGECAPTQLVPASQACDLAEESALEFNPDQSQDAWGAPESLDAWSAPSPVSPPRTAARSPPRAEGWSPAPKAPTPPPTSPLPKAPSPVAVQSPKIAAATEPADDELRRWVFARVSREDDLQNVTVKTITNELKAAFGGIKVKGARKALVKAAIVEALAQQAQHESSESEDEAPPSEARRLGFDDLVEDEEEEPAPVVAEDDTEERPMNPYLFFSKLKRSEVRAEVDGDEAFAELSGGKRNAEATKRLGVLWKALSEEDKRRYKDEAPLIKCKKRKSTKKRKSVEAADAPAFDPEAHAAEYAQLCETEDKPQEKLPEEVAETEAQLEAAKRAAAIEEAIAAEEAAADQEAEAKREALAASIKQRFEEDARKEELAARATLAKLMKEESSDDDSDVELEIVGAPSPAKKARRESLSPSKSSTIEALKRARTKRAGGRRALRDKLRAKAARAGMVKYAEQASVEDISADDYVRRLEALDAQRVVEAREAERRDREERELEQKLRAAGRRFAEIDAREEELFVPDAEDALAMDRAAAQDAIQACLDAQRRLSTVPEESPEAWSSPSPEPAPSATVLAEDAPSATVLAEDLAPAASATALAEYLEAPAPQDSEVPATAADGVSAEQAAEDSELAPAASATALAEDLAPAEQEEAADGITAAQAAEDSPNKAAEPAADANDDDAAPRIEDMEIEEEERPKKDRNAAYKALLEADARRAKQKTAHGIEGEAEESDEEGRAQMGLGDFGFGVSKPKADAEETEDVRITEDDLEAVVDELSDGEGDEEGAEAQRAKEERKREREEMAQMLRRVRDGFGGQDARGGAFRIDDLVGMDASARKEAKRLGLEDSDDEEIRKLRAGSDDEDEEDDDDEGDEERGLAALISQELKNRHLGDRLRRKQEPLISESESESEDEQEAVKAGSDSEEDEAAIKIKSRQWARRAKMRRVLDEKAAREKAEREANGEAPQGGAALLDADEDSQLILSMLSRTQSSRSVSSQRSGELPSSLDRAPSLIRSASDSQAAWLPAAKKPRLGTGVSQQAEDTLLGRCGSFFAALDRSHSAGAPSAKSHAAKAAKTAVSLSSLFGLDASSQGFPSSRSGAGKAPAKGPTSFAGIASGAS